MIKFIKDINNENINIDNGIFFSQGVFETILIKEKAMFLSQHIKRLNESTNKIGINNSIEVKEIEDIIKMNNINNCVLKILVTEKNAIITIRENNYSDVQYNEGLSICVSKVVRNSTSMLTYIKSTSYIENIIEKQKAVNSGYDEVLFLNENSYIAECSTSNIFWIKDDIIYSPNIESGLLPGIVRSWLVDNYNIKSGFYHFEDLINADEVFITNSIVGIIKVSKINDKKFENSLCIEKIMQDYLLTLEGM